MGQALAAKMGEDWPTASNGDWVYRHPSVSAKIINHILIDLVIWSPRWFGKVRQGYFPTYYLKRHETKFRLGSLFFTFNLNPFPNKPWFVHVCGTSLLKTLWDKEKLLVTSHFSLSHSVFYSLGKLTAILIKSEIVDCNLFQLGPVQNIVVW